MDILEELRSATRELDEVERRIDIYEHRWGVDENSKEARANLEYQRARVDRMERFELARYAYLN